LAATVARGWKRAIRGKIWMRWLARTRMWQAIQTLCWLKSALQDH
jgi:hypothetical protein